MMRRAILFLPLVAISAPAMAQQGGGHERGEYQGAAPAPPPPAEMPMDHDVMDHGTMDHSTMGHASPDGEDEIPSGPPPAEAFSGPTFAADAFVGAEVMAQSRADVARMVSGLPVFWFQADRAELRVRDGADGYLWDVQAYYGGDIDKIWFKSEGESDFGGALDAAEIQGLWSHAFDPWWDIQLGIRQDLTGAKRSHAVIGVQGLGPFLFEIDAAAFLSNTGDVTARIEAELDQRITQRLILQPRAELNLSAQDIPELGTGAGMDSAEIGMRLRYEFTREFAPYVGIEQEWKIGNSADYARTSGDDPRVTNLVLGIRFWF